MRELEFSKMTLRLVHKDDPKPSSEEDIVAKLTGDTLPTLQQILYTPTPLTLRSQSGEISKVVVSARYIPVQMKLDPKESINNMGTLTVKVNNAVNLPIADRNGKSDPYCKFFVGDDNKHAVFKSKTVEKDLNPTWNEGFEMEVKTRIDANFRIEVWDYDRARDDDLLGKANIDLKSLTPFEKKSVTVTLTSPSKDVTLPSNGKPSTVNLTLLFKPTYVMRSRQGSSTFAGGVGGTVKTIGGAPIKVVGGVGGFVGGNVTRGASFLGKGLISRLHKDKDHNGDDAASIANSTIEEYPETRNNGGLSPAAALVDGTTTPPTPVTPQKEHARTRSTASTYGDRLSVFGGGGGGARGDTGTAHITIVSASGFPSSANLRVVVRVQGTKGGKEVHKSKAHKAGDEPVQYDESFKVPKVTAGSQYQIRVVDHSTFGSDDLLGEGFFLVADQGSEAGQDKAVSVGPGSVVIRSSFDAPEAALRPTTSHSTAGGEIDGADSPKMPRRSFLSKRSVSGA